MSFILNSEHDKKEMLDTIGIKSGNMEELFSCIPKHLRAKEFNLPAGKSDYETEMELRALAQKNKTDIISFLGAGVYDHYIPAVVDAISSRSEFYTAYTPYQPEASQGSLQAIYEYQSLMCRLTGMEVSNASLYDGGTALYEAAMMAIHYTGRNKIIIDCGVNPIYRKLMYSYTHNLSIDFVEVEVLHGQADRAKIKKVIDDKTAAIILQNPNFFGAIDDHSDISEICHKSGALVIENVYPISLGILKTPFEMGADIATGEGQSLGMPLSFGGPYLGFITSRKTFVRKMPGRIVGRTNDGRGACGFVLTLQAREQHIRREKATSNICTNQALCALRALVYMTSIGKEGLKELAELCFEKAEYAKLTLERIKGVTVKRSSPTFNEFTVMLSRDPNIVVEKMMDKGFEAGFPLGRYYKDMKSYMVIAVTEKRTKKEIDTFAEALESIL